MNNRWLALLLPLMSLFLCLSCGADYQVTEKVNLRVVVDSYVQPDKLEKLDVLVVLDTSGSMKDNYDDVADGASGNRKLAFGCFYCEHKRTCWSDTNEGKGLRVFHYANGYRYLTQVKKAPNVEEVTDW